MSQTRLFEPIGNGVRFEASASGAEMAEMGAHSGHRGSQHEGCYRSY